MRRTLLCCLLLLLSCRSATPPGPLQTPEPPLPADTAEAVAPPEPEPAAEEAPPEAPVEIPPARPVEAPEPVPEVPAEPVEQLPVMPARVRVGLASDLPQVTLPCCDSGVTAQLAERSLALVAPIEVRPAAGAAHAGFYRLQVAALKDQRQAEALAQQLASQLDQPADARFDAAIDLYRVRVGRYASRDAANAAKEQLALEGLTGAWVASEGGGLSEAGLRVTQGKESYLLPGRWLTLSSDGGGGVRFQGQRYRGSLRVYLNDRGTLNLINELSVEDYLRGVVPKEMGPVRYDQLEALKAQAVAARTYTVRHLGEFAQEGYDICATPRCQVYGGMEVEHPLSDRAVAETAGEVVLFGGEPINAMYTAACGGHTEDSEVVFPLIRDPYLRGVACLEAGLQTLEGSLPAGRRFPEALLEGLLTTASQDRRQGLEAQLRQLGSLAGLVLPDDHLASLDRRELQRFVASLYSPKTQAAMPPALRQLLRSHAPRQALALYLLQTRQKPAAFQAALPTQQQYATIDLPLLNFQSRWGILAWGPYDPGLASGDATNGGVFPNLGHLDVLGGVRAAEQINQPLVDWLNRH